MIEAEGLPDYLQWVKTNGPGFTPLKYLRCVANLELAVAFTHLFWPNFVEHDGGIFLADGFDEPNYQDWRRTESRTNTEKVMNHRHMQDLLQGEISAANLRHLAETLVAMWKCRLASLYPGRNIVVEMIEEDEGEEGEGPVITVYQPAEA
jgi:hypothetical protein